MKKIFILTHQDFTGDNNQLSGIAKAFNTLANKTSTYEDWFDISQLAEDDLVLVAGDHGLLKAQEIKRTSPDTKVIWSGHQIFAEFEQIKLWPDIIALPKSAVTPAFIERCSSHCTLVQTDGVSHNIDETLVSEAFNDFTGMLPSDDIKACVGMIIAGDAPTSDKTTLCFDQEDAVKQATLIVDKIKQSGFDPDLTAILVTNGPRTGKHDPLTTLPMEPDPHRTGQTDLTSDAFVAELEKHFKQVSFYDFQYGRPSAYQPMMHRITMADKALWFVPAESSSMVTESSYLSAREVPVYVYTPASANNTHMALVRNAVSNGLVKMIENTDLVTEASPRKIQLAAVQIAREIEKMLDNLSKVTPKISPYLELTLHGNSSENRGDDFTTAAARPMSNNPL